MFSVYITKPQLNPLLLFVSTLSQHTISDQRDDFQQLVLMIVQREVIPEFKALQGNTFVTGSPLYSVLHETVVTLAQNLSWLQALTMKQDFYWGIIASCCEKIPITEEEFEWVDSYESAIACLGGVYRSYCEKKKFPRDKCLLCTEDFPQEITLSPSEHIKKYELT